MNGVLEIGVGQHLHPAATEILLADGRTGQGSRSQIMFPYAEPARFGREPKARRIVFLFVQPIGDLGHESGVMALEPCQALALQCHVDLAREEIGQLSFGIADRSHQQAVPERLAGLSIVEDVDPDGLDRVHRRPDGGDGFGGGPRPLQEAAVASDDLLAGIAA